MQKSPKTMFSILLALLSLALVFGLGWYRSSLSEGANLNFSLPQKVAEGKIRPVIADLAGNGLPKRILQPGLVRLSSHGLVNKGTKDYNLQFELTDNCLPVNYIVQDSAWDKKNLLLNRPFRPGESLAINIIFDVPKELQNNNIIYEGNLKVFDYQTKEQLALVPIKIINSKTSVSGSGGDCCSTQ